MVGEWIDWVRCCGKLGGGLGVNGIDEVKVVFVGEDVCGYVELKG